MKEITELKLIKINDEEYYVYRFGCFFSAGVAEIEDDYGFKFLISKDLTSAFLVNDRGNFKIVTLEEVAESIKSIKVLSEVTGGIYGNETMEELCVKPIMEMNTNELNVN